MDPIDQSGLIDDLRRQMRQLRAREENFYRLQFNLNEDFRRALSTLEELTVRLERAAHDRWSPKRGIEVREAVSRVRSDFQNLRAGLAYETDVLRRAQSPLWMPPPYVLSRPFVFADQEMYRVLGGYD